MRAVPQLEVRIERALKVQNDINELLDKYDNKPCAFCVYCTKSDYRSYLYCHRPEYKKYDIVTNVQSYSSSLCETERRNAYGQYCGASGKFFKLTSEQKRQQLKLKEQQIVVQSVLQELQELIIKTAK